MSIILNEYEWAEQMISDRNLGKRPVETLSRVAKYYLENKYSKTETRRMLEEFLSQCAPSASMPQWSDTLDRIVRNAGKYPLIRVEDVVVYRQELERIESLTGKQIRRLAFVLLCVAKYWDAARGSNDHWVNSSDREILRMANIGTSVRRQSAMFAALRDAGLIRFSKKVDNLNVQVLFIQDGGEAVLHIRDFRNLGYQYLQFCGGPYFQCAGCGLTVRERDPSNGRKQKYCPGCAAEIHMRQNVGSVMRHRNASKQAGASC